jgi:hypothetical protein
MVKVEVHKQTKCDRDKGYGSWAMQYPGTTLYLCEHCWDLQNRITGNDYKFPIDLTEYPHIQI